MPSVNGERVDMSFILLVIVVIILCVLIKKYRDPEVRKKDEENRRKAREEWKNNQRKAREDWEAWKADAPERKRQKEEAQAIRREAERRRTTVVSTRLIGEGSAEYKKSIGGMAFRGAVGGFFAGPAGAVLGMATAKNKNTNKNIRRFLVKYLDGHIEEKEAAVGSSMYKEYMAHLEWDNN